MRQGKQKREQTFPVEAGSEPASREARIAGMVQRVWANSVVYHEDVEPLLRHWLQTEGYSVGPEEFAALLSRAHGEFSSVAATKGEDQKPSCPPEVLVDRIYDDVERLERTALPGDGSARP